MCLYVFFVGASDIDPSSVGPIFAVLIGPTREVRELTIRHWDAAISTIVI